MGVMLGPPVSSLTGVRPAGRWRSEVGPASGRSRGHHGVEQRRRRGPPGDGDADGHEQVACLPAALLAERTKGGSSSSASKLTSPTAAIDRRAAAERRPRWSRHPSAWARARPGRPRCRRGTRSRRMVADGVEPRQPLADHGQERGEVVRGRGPDGRARCAACASTARARNGSVRSTSSSSASRRIHWPLSQSRRSRSKTAPLGWTRSRSKRSTSSSKREDLLVRARRPAQEREVVDDGLAHVPLLDVVGDRGLALALAHLGPVGVEDERQVREDRRRRRPAPGTAGCAWACWRGGPRPG